ncbi:hypothetical protein ALON55S_05218 [Alishewanella longhuensis]
MPVSAAPDAREAIRAFALHWQLKAEQIAQAGFADKTQQDFANLLVSRAHGLYDLFDNEQLLASLSGVSCNCHLFFTNNKAALCGFVI